jgi:hypothetical protein
VKPSGSLGERDILEVVQELSASRWSGRLRLERAGDRITITVDKGLLVFASSSNADHRLGPKLLRRGAITLRQMEDAGKALSPGKRLGTILVEQGVLDPKELVRAVVDQARDIILQAFRWTSGSYRLEEGAAPGEAITLSISTPELIFEGVSRIEAWSRIERGCGGLAARFAPVAATEALFKELTLDVDQAALLRSVKGVKDVETLCKESILNHFEVCRDLWAFRVIGLVRRVEETAPLDDDGLEYVLPADEGGT